MKDLMEQKDKKREKTERQKERKTERQKDKKTERRKDRNTGKIQLSKGRFHEKVDLRLDFVQINSHPPHVTLSDIQNDSLSKILLK